MERKAFYRLVVLTVLVMALVGLNAHPAVAKDDDIVIAPISSTPEGQTYGRWAAEWWQWAEGVPADVNPVTDTTGDHCAQRQVDNVWFLAGSFGSDPVVRTCEIPSGKSLFLRAHQHLLRGVPERPASDSDRGVRARVWELHGADADLGAD